VLGQFRLEVPLLSESAPPSENNEPDRHSVSGRRKFAPAPTNRPKISLTFEGF
jgi:hypothetical protein